MSVGPALRLLATAVLVTTAVACATYRGPRGIESAIEDQFGANLEREFGLELGWTTTKIAGAIVAHDGGEEAGALDGITGIGVVVFKLHQAAAQPARLDPRRLDLGDFETVLDARDRDGQVLVLAKAHRGSIHEVLLLACDVEEVVVARLRGDLDRLVERVTRAADEEGVRGARRAVPIASR